MAEASLDSPADGSGADPEPAELYSGIPKSDLVGRFFCGLLGREPDGVRRQNRRAGCDCRFLQKLAPGN
jgi:hypothetical protein